MHTELFPQDDARTVAASVGKSIVEGKSFAKLSITDLQNFGILQGKSFTEYMFSELKLGDSLQKEAFEQLVANIPPPIDTDVVYEAQRKNPLSTDDEMAIRLANLQSQDAPLVRIKTESSKAMRNFAYTVLSKAGYYQTKDDNSFDPEQLKGNLELMEKITQAPGVISVDDGNRCFALYVPKEVRSEFASFVAAMMGPPPIENYIVVTDPDKNSELATELFSNDNLVRYFLADAVVRIQREMVSGVERTFSDVASKKYDEIKKELDSFDAPIKKHFFELLLHETTGKEVVFTRVFRDRHDVEAIQGKSEPKVDRTGSESNATSYRLRSSEDGIISFEFESIEASWAKNDPKTNRRKQINTTVQQYVEVRFNDEAHEFEYRWKDKNGEFTEWENQDGQYGGPGYAVKNVFEGSSIFSLSQRLERGTDVKGIMQRVSDELVGTRSAAEYCNKLRDLGLAGYPSTEYIVHDSAKANIVFGVYPPQYSL